MSQGCAKKHNTLRKDSDGGPEPSEEQVQEFIISIKSGLMNRMKQFLHKFKHNITNRLEAQQRQPPLYFACLYTEEKTSLQFVKMLLKWGANPKFRDSHEQTVIFYLCRDGKKKVAQYLLQHGCSLEDEDLYGQTPAFYVASENRVQMLDLFTDQMLYHVDKLAKQTLLFYAARKGHLPMCKALIERGCDPTHQDQHKKTASDFAKKAKFQQVADYLSQEIKRVKETNKEKSQSILLSSEQLEPKRKKKESQALNHTKNTYKITFINENGSTRDLTESEVKDLVSKLPEVGEYLMNPALIPQQMLQSTLQQTWQKLAIKILNICWKVKGAFWFHEPVDIEKYNLTDYFDIVKKPMDFGTIKKRLSHNFYSRADQFIADMRLVWSNTYKYNGRQHEVSKIGSDIQKLFQDSIKKMGLTKFLKRL